MKNENKGGAKAPRTHQSHWQDHTSTTRQQKRRQRLDEIAQAVGFKSWSELETAALNKQIQITRKLLDETPTH